MQVIKLLGMQVLEKFLLAVIPVFLRLGPKRDDAAGGSAPQCEKLVKCKQMCDRYSKLGT